MKASDAFLRFLTMGFGLSGRGDELGLAQTDCGFDTDLREFFVKDVELPL